MGPFIAEFVGTTSHTDPILAVAHTANLAIEALHAELRQRIQDSETRQVQEIIDQKKIPASLQQDEFERDARAILYGSSDLRPHIAIRRLPPSTA